jgi:hypothetical protein
MIKEIEQIANAMITLNSQVYGAILSEKDLNILEKSLRKIKSIQNHIHNLLQESSLVSVTNDNDLKEITNIHKLLIELGTAAEEIEELSSKFVCNYEEEWNIIKTNQA